jgi:hypothetical protein
MAMSPSHRTQSKRRHRDSKRLTGRLKRTEDFAMTMTAVVLAPDGNITLEERPQPALRSDQIMVAVDLCGICGSDLHAAQLTQVYRGNCILGHESTGRIVALGGEVTAWSVGQRVAVNPNGNVCGICVFCTSGRPNFCRQATLETALGLQVDGALAPLMAAFPSHLRAIPPRSTPRGPNLPRRHCARWTSRANSEAARCWSPAVGPSVSWRVDWLI